MIVIGKVNFIMILNMKTKYIKVSERLPDNDGDYSTDQGELSFKVKTKDWYYAGWRYNHKVGFWLEEVPDYEEEMKDLLVKVDEEQCLLGYVTSDTHCDLEELLTKLKQS